MKKHLYIFYILLIAAQPMNAQWINSIQINPPMPTTADSISLIYSADFPASGCDILGYLVNISEHTITINATHELGILTVICTSVQTIPIGLLPEGNYTLTLNLFIPGSNTSQSMSFNVTGPVNFTEQTTSDHSFQVFPNPSYDHLQIKTPASSENDNISLLIFNSIGLEVFRSENIPEDFILIDISEIPKGQYYLRILRNQQVLENKTLIFN